MTKLIVRGSPTGTGSVTLRPPVVETDIELEMPLSGTHLSGANAEGMPQLNDGTPVVESGSNSDGEWIRWADGTQQVQGVLSENQVAAISTGYDASFIDYPLPFIQRPYMGSTSLRTTIVTDPQAISTLDNYYFSCRNNSQWGARAKTNLTSSEVTTLVITASGRWK